jgi:hypothetical protein
MTTIASAGNADTACLQFVLEKGYKIKAFIEDMNTTFYAEKDGESFAAENGMELLGLITLWENYKYSWQSLLGKDTYENIK